MRRLSFATFRVYNVSNIKVSCTLSEPNHTEDAQPDTWVDIRDNVASIFLVNEAAATEKGKMSVAKCIADVLNIDLSFVAMIMVLSTGLDNMMKLQGIGPLILPADDADDDYAPTPMSVIPRIVHLSPTSTAAREGGADGERASRATRSFFNHASRDEATIQPSVVSTDPSQSLLLYVTSERGREDMERSTARARTRGIPPATRFRDTVAASTEPVQQLALPSHLGGTALDLAPMNSTALSSAPARLASSAYIEAGVALGDVNALAEQLQELNVRSSMAPRQSYTFAEIEHPPARALEVGFLGEQHVSTLCRPVSFLRLTVNQVYELLKSTLPDFTGANWTSELRRFAELPPFSGISYADFQYQDHSGELTRQLLPHEPEVHGATPEVFIEVKSTSGSQDNIFHMSSQQFRRVSHVLFLLLDFVLIDRFESNRRLRCGAAGTPTQYPPSSTCYSA